MIKNDIQLRRARSRLGDVSNEIGNYQKEYHGVELEFYLTPLEIERNELTKDIDEYLLLRDMPFEEGISELARNPSLIDNIGELLAKIRIASKCTQKEVAEKLGWEQPNLSRFESGKYSSQSISKIVQFASALEVFLFVTPALDEVESEIKFFQKSTTVFVMETGSTAADSYYPGYTGTASEDLSKFFIKQLTFGDPEGKYSNKQSEELEVALA